MPLSLATLQSVADGVKRGRWFLATAFVILGISYFAFDLYVQRTGIEIIDGWRMNEAVAIQQGNLLTSISKNQRLLLSSDFIRGIALVDSSRTSLQELIKFGEGFARHRVVLKDGRISLVRSGLIRFVAIVPIEGYPDLRVEFLIAPRYALALFLGYALIMLGLTLVSLYRAVRNERVEASRRAELLQIALNDFVSGNNPSPVILATAPRLVDGWNDLKRGLAKAQEREIELASSARFADLARQVSHDIRSPLSALKMVSASGLPEEKAKLIKMTVDRINGIAESMLSKTRSTEPQMLAKPTFVAPIIEAIVSEKRLAFDSGSAYDLNLRVDPPLVSFALCAPADLQRVMSNLINNSIEAFKGPGKVDVALQTYAAEVVITVADNGPGIPADILPRLFAAGATFGKSNGNGLGLHHAKATVEAWGGRFDLVSKEGLGTVITMRLKRSSEPS